MSTSHSPTANPNPVSSVWYPLPFDAPCNVAAYVDGLFQDEIRGWIVDVQRPERIVTVCVRINDSLAGKVTACGYRGDLAPLFHSSGIHGFAFRVPERFFAETVWQVEVLLEDGRHLGPRPIKISNPSAVRGPVVPLRSPCLLCIHIPKTAGTAFRSALAQRTHISRHLLLYPDPPGFPGEYAFYLSESQLANLESVYGHFGFRFHKFMPQPCEYATVLREPTTRTLSHLVQLRHASCVDAAASHDDFFFNSVDTAFDNIMTRLISGETADILPFGEVNESVFEHAVDNLHTWFTYVGLQERADDTHRELSDRLGVEPRKLELANVSNPKHSQTISPTTLSAIRNMNGYDQRLYDYVRDHFWNNGKKGWVK